MTLAGKVGVDDAKRSCEIALGNHVLDDGWHEVSSEGKNDEALVGGHPRREVP